MTGPRIAIAGISLEASVFSPALTMVADFIHSEGDGYFADLPFFSRGTPLRDESEWHALSHYRAIPGGPVPKSDFAEMAQRIYAEIGALIENGGPPDGILLDIHGAMSVVGLDDPEGELAEEIRLLVGPDTVISTGMDLHGNVTPRLATAVDLITCYRMAPHEDALETKERAARNLVDRLARPARSRRPFKAWIPIPILLPGEKTSTRVEPARSLYALIPDVLKHPGILDAGIWIGYAWADERRNHAAVMVVGDDQEAVGRGAELLAERMWAVRDEFDFAAPTGTLSECLDTAIASPARPFFISDSGDNPTAGGAGDVPWTLAQLLNRTEIIDRQVEVVYASIPDPVAVEACLEVGVGGNVSLTVGAIVDNTVTPPVPLMGQVEHIHIGDPAAAREVVVRCGGLRVILTDRRKPYHREVDFTQNGIDARTADIVVVKIGYLEPELYDMSADWLLALTPGGVDQDFRRLPYHRIMRPMVPFDQYPGSPDLSARFIPASNMPVTPTTKS
jgi:microcystin degradation protein MlrC